MRRTRSFHDLQHALEDERAALVEHPLYGEMATIEDVRVFSEQHVFAMWDFMSLLKSLQRELTCVDVPWLPRGDALARRLVNEIVLGEESDESPSGGYTSHFELYRASMLESGADVSRIDTFVKLVAQGESIELALRGAKAPPAAARFALSTFDAIRSRSTVRIAAAFTIGREDIIPAMFVRLLEDLSRTHGPRLTLFSDYFARHIQIDGERHGPMAARLLEDLCRDDEAAWREAYAGARDALVARKELWDGIRTALVGARPATRALARS